MTPSADRPNAPALDGPDAMRLLDTAPAGFLVVDAGTNIVTYANATLCRVIDSTVDALLGKTVQELFLPSSADTITSLLAEHSDADTDIPAGATADLIAGPGAKLRVLLMANQSTEAAGEVVRLTFHTATAHGTVEQVLTDARDDAVHAQSAAENALSRSEDALEESEDARKSAEAERTQVQILATTLQRTLLPPILTAPPGTEVSAYYHHASEEEVGGDFYDIFPLDPHTWGFFLGDVSGKGAGAAAVTSLTRYTLRAAAVFDRDPVSVLQNLNTVLHHEFQGDDPRFCTVVYGTITPTDGSVAVTLASGGHPPALHLRADGTAGYVDTLGGQLVGALEDPLFRAAELTLEPGDVLLLYTDGLTEAHVGPGRIRYDDTGALMEFADAAGPTTAARVVDDLIGVLNGFGSGLQDDVALLAVGAPAVDA